MLRPGYCTLCRSRCGTLNEVVGDRLLSVRPNPAHPTGKATCAKGRSAPELIDSPHRQLYPLRRTTPKDSDDPKWQRISWEEALAEVAERLETFKAQSGPESVAFGVTTPSGTPLSDSIDWIERFIRHYGSPNTCYATEICNWHKDFAHAFTFGCGIQPADYGNADVILLWGHNPTNTWLAQADAIARGRQRGAKLIVVDPRPTALAKEADVWLRVHPGTDAALALGLIRQMIETEAWDQAFTRSWTNGPLLVRIDNGEFLRSADLWPDEVEAGSYLVWNEETNQAERFDPDARDNIHRSTNWAMRGVFNLSSAGEAQGTEGTICCTPAFALLEQGAEAYTVNYVCRVTGVDPLALAEAGRLLRAGQRIAYHSWTGVGQHTNATQTERSIAALYALTGSFDRVGANRVRRGPLVRQVNALELLPAIREKALGYRERPIGPPAHGWVTARDLYRAILEGLPYKVRALVAFGTNPLISHGDPETGDAALRALEFHVHCDLFLTPSARHADIFLPVNTPWEREGLRVGFEISDEAAALVQLRQRFVSPRGEARSDNDIVFDLACRLGMREAFFDGSLEAGWDYILNPAGLSVEQLRGEPGGVACAIDSREQKYALEHHDGSARLRGFDTETRRIELYSATLHRHGQPAVPAYVPIAPAGSDQPQRYPLTLSTAKNGFYCHSQHRSLVSLRKKAPDPVAEMGPGLAAIKGIRAGDWILVSTSTGDARFRAQITPQLNDNVVVAEFGWWQACEELDRPEMPSTGPLNSNFNRLVTTADHDPVSGSVLHRALACDVKLDPQTEEHQRGWPGLREFRVSRLHAEAEGVTEVHLEPIDAAGLPDYRPGQHIQVSVPGPDDGTLTRAYSLTGPASVHGRHQLQIAVRHQKGIGSDGAAFEGRMSSKVNTHWRVGDTVYVTAPNGSFVLPRNHRQPIILLAGGIGITPVISLLESLPDGCANTITLLYANLNSRTHAFRTAIRRHQARLPGLTVRNHYDSPLEVDRLGVDYDSCERITSDVIADALLRDRPRVYMCGPPAMMDAFADGLIRRGMPKFDIFREVFRSPPELPIDDGRTFSVRFPNSSADAVWSPGEGTLLSFAESLGLALPSGCRVGQCESCAVRIASGHVRHLHGHEPEDPETCLTCQAVPTEDLILVN